MRKIMGIYPFVMCVCGHVYWAHWITTGQCAHCDCHKPKKEVNNAT